MEIPVAPVPKPRMTRSDQWKKRPATTKYWEYKDALREAYKGKVPDTLLIRFQIAMPNSWSKAKKDRMRNTPHQQRPDIDNYLKAFLDALCEDDSYVWNVACSKSWANKGSIIVSNPEEAKTHL